MFTREQFLERAERLRNSDRHTGDDVAAMRQAAAQAQVLEQMRAWAQRMREEWLARYAKVSEEPGMHMSASYADGSQSQFERMVNELTRLEREAGLR